MQTAIDKLLSRDISKLDVRTININKDRDGVEIKLIGYPEAIKQIADTVTPWKQVHSRRNLVESELRELVISVLAGALPDVDPSQRDSFQDRLLPYVRVICGSSLDLLRN